MRTLNSARNSLFIVISKILSILLAFVTRTLIIKLLGGIFVGIEGTFSSVLSVLSMAELGIASAISFALYTPIAENNTKKITAYMEYFRKFYIIVGVGVFVVGVCLIPALPYLIKMPDGVEQISHLNLYYILSLLAVSFSYLLTSRRILFEADQQNYKLVTVDTIIMFVSQGMQIAVIALTKEYAWVLLSKLIINIAGNLVIHIYAKKRYPYLVEFRKEKLRKIDKKNLYGNMTAILAHKVGSVLVTGTDVLLISSIIGIMSASIYSNYLLIISSIAGIVTMGINVFMPSVGNMRAENFSDIDHHIKVFNAIFFFGFWVITFTAVCLLCLINPFIKLVWGSEYLFGLGIVSVLIINYYISSMRFSIGVFATAGGYFKETVFKPILEGVLNIVFSLLSMKYLGVLGVFLGTTVSLVFGSLWVDPYIVFKKWFKKSSVGFFIKYILYLILFAIICAISYCLCSFVSIENGFLELFVKLIICITIPNALLLAIFFKNENFRYLLNIGKEIYLKISKKH